MTAETNHETAEGEPIADQLDTIETHLGMNQSAVRARVVDVGSDTTLLHLLDDMGEMEHGRDRHGVPQRQRTSTSRDRNR